MSSPGDPFDPSLVAGFGQRDPYYRPARIFTQGPLVEVENALIKSDLAWSSMKDGIQALADHADELQRQTMGANDAGIRAAREALSQAASEVEAARRKAFGGYKLGIDALLRYRG
jgi:hypothetical protein